MIEHASIDQGAQQPFAPAPRTLAVGRLGIVELLLADLDTVTHAGQRYTMGKIVVLLQDESADSGGRLSELQRRSIRRALDDLAREQDRMLPDGEAFAARVRSIAGTLTLC
jgi:hypothetical protein